MLSRTQPLTFLSLRHVAVKRPGKQPYSCIALRISTVSCNSQTILTNRHALPNTPTDTLRLETHGGQEASYSAYTATRYTILIDEFIQTCSIESKLMLTFARSLTVKQKAAFLMHTEMESQNSVWENTATKKNYAMNAEPLGNYYPWLSYFL